MLYVFVFFLDFSARNFAPRARLDEDAEAMRWFYFPFEEVGDNGKATRGASCGSSPRIVDVKVYQRPRSMPRGDSTTDKSSDGGQNAVSAQSWRSFLLSQTLNIPWREFDLARFDGSSAHISA